MCLCQMKKCKISFRNTTGQSHVGSWLPDEEGCIRDRYDCGTLVHPFPTSHGKRPSQEPPSRSCFHVCLLHHVALRILRRLEDCERLRQDFLGLALWRDEFNLVLAALSACLRTMSLFWFATGSTLCFWLQTRGRMETTKHCYVQRHLILIWCRRSQFET